jgi:hypothetical protein
METRAATQDHTSGKISIRWHKLFPLHRVTMVLWSHLDDAGLLKQHEMTPWVKGHSNIMAVRAYSGGLKSFRHKFTLVTRGYDGQGPRLEFFKMA